MNKTIPICFVLLIGFLCAQTWESIGPGHGRIIQIKADPDCPDTIFAVHEGFSEPAMSLLRTFDGGETWDTLGSYNGFDFHPATPETVFAAFGIGSFSDGILRSNNYGTTFEPMAVHWLYLADGICFDRTDPTYVYAWGMNISYSRNAGLDWADVAGPGIAAVYYGMTVDPFANNNIWAWNEAGELRHSTDHGVNWITEDTFTEDIAAIDVAVSPLDTQYIYIANWNGISRSEDYGVTWEDIRMISPPTNCVIVSDYTPESIIFGGAYGVCSSMDGGESYDFVGDSVEFEIFDLDIVPLSVGGYRIFAGTAGNGVMVIDANPFSDGPLAGNPYPSDESWVSLDSFDITLRLSDPDGVLESSVSLDVNGTTYSTSDPELAFDDTLLIFSDYFDDGDTITVQLLSAEDALGNPSDMLPFEWSFIIDRTPPIAEYVYPGPDDTVEAEPFIYKMHLIDEGSGLDLPSYVSFFNSVTVYSSCISFLYDADTVLIDLNTAGLVLEEGDTVNVSISVGDSVDIGDPNLFEDEWSFYVVRSGIDEIELPYSQNLRVVPNPFNAVCRIETPWNFRIYDASGRIIYGGCPVEGRAFWDGRDENGSPVSSGVFLVRTSGGQTARIILLR